MSDVRPLLGDDDLVTGEAVALDLPPPRSGSGWPRGLDRRARRGAPARRWSSSSPASSSAPPTTRSSRSPTLRRHRARAGRRCRRRVETLTRGRSLGKLALGLRTVRDDAGPISFRHAFIRALVGVVEIWMLQRRAGLRLRAGDAARQADRRRGGRHLRGARAVPVPGCSGRPPMPPHLAGWAADADIAPLPDGLALAVRQFLGRAAASEPGLPRALGTQLLEQVLPHVAPAPPPGQHPEARAGGRGRRAPPSRRAAAGPRRGAAGPVAGTRR